MPAEDPCRELPHGTVHDAAKIGMVTVSGLNERFGLEWGLFPNLMQETYGAVVSGPGLRLPCSTRKLRNDGMGV